MTNFTVMKKLLSVLCFLCVPAATFAQTISFTLTTPACNNNGLLTSVFTGVTPPLKVSYTTYGTTSTTIVHTGVAGLADAFTNYSGGPVLVSVSDNFGGMTTNFYPGAAPINISFNTFPAICPTPDTAMVTVSGGTAPYTYEWFNVNTLGVVSTDTMIAMQPGTYGLTVTDAAGCVYDSMVDNNFAVLSSIPTYSVVMTTTTANCTDGTATAALTTGAVFPVTYAWSNGGTTPMIIGLQTGFYDVTVVDALGCTVTSTGNYVPQAITITTPVTTTGATCLGNDGSVSAVGAGGTAPYSYKWSNGGLTQSQNGIAPGFYTVTTTDVNGCIGMDNGFVGGPAPIVVSYTTTPTLCTSATGSATLKISGGTPPYAAMWYTSPAQTGNSAINLKQGDYEYAVTDAAGCHYNGIASVNPTDVISASFMSVPSSCSGATGSMTVYPVGGVAPYKFSWSTGATTSKLTGVGNGMYTVTITDVMGCTAKFSQAMTDNSGIGVGLYSTSASCLFVNDGTFTAAAFGGTPPYHYAWTGGGSTSSIINLPPRIPYWVKVTDANGCSVTDSATLDFDTSSACFCVVTGTVYNDANGNCIMDPDEAGIQNVQIHIGNGYTYTDSFGHYSYRVTGGSYTVAETLPSYLHLSPCQSNNIAITSVPATACVINADFANTVDTVHDLYVRTWDFNQPVAGGEYSQITIVGNHGTAHEASILAKHTTDGQVFQPVFIPNVYFKGGSNVYETVDSFPVLDQGNAYRFLVNYSVPQNLASGASLKFSDTVALVAPIANWNIDNAPGDNVSGYTTTVAAKSAPNFIQVYPQGSGIAGVIAADQTDMEYMIHFQNMRDYTAEHVEVVDTLDDHLDWTTLTPIYASSHCIVTVEQIGLRKVARFRFDYINLPSAGSEPVKSNGLVVFGIKASTGLAVGTQIKNRASVYFDHYAPSGTNQTLNTIGSLPIDKVKSVAQAANTTFRIYPNPASLTCNAVISSDVAGSAEMSVSDITGRIMSNGTLALQKGMQTIPVDIARLSVGMYFVNFAQNGKVQTQKLVVVKQ